MRELRRTSAKIEAMIGRKYGRLLVIEAVLRPVGRHRMNHTHVVCRCECGRTTISDPSWLRRHPNVSCGHCVQRKRVDWLVRFWAKVRKTEGGCWVWTASCCPKGYGKFSIPNSNWSLAHRASWEIAKGPIPKGLCVLHDCDNPPCVNPDHLFLGSLRENNLDMLLKRRHVHGERVWSAKLTESEVREIRNIGELYSQSAIAAHYGVNQSTIQEILQWTTWRHVL